MKKYISILIASIIIIACMGAFLETEIGTWRTARSAVAASDTLLDGTTAGYTYAFADKPSAAIRLNSAANAGDMYFYGTIAANKTATFRIWAWKVDGPAKLLYSGTVTTGAAVTGATNTFYVDTITETVNNNGCVVTDSGNDRVSILQLGDLRGYKWIYCSITLVDITALTVNFTSY